MSKLCPVCLKTKDLTKFRVHGLRKDGHFNECEKCNPFKKPSPTLASLVKTACPFCDRLVQKRVLAAHYMTIVCTKARRNKLK